MGHLILRSVVGFPARTAAPMVGHRIGQSEPRSSGRDYGNYSLSLRYRCTQNPMAKDRLRRQQISLGYNQRPAIVGGA